MPMLDYLILGVEPIDTQHKQLFRAIDDLYAACKQGKGRQEVIHTLEFLQQYVIKHFGDEEIIQKKSGYPKYPQHKAQHQYYINQLEQLKSSEELEGTSVLLVSKVNVLVNDWLITHINKTDRELAEYLRAHQG